MIFEKGNVNFIV